MGGAEEGRSSVKWYEASRRVTRSHVGDKGVRHTDDKSRQGKGDTGLSVAREQRAHRVPSHPTSQRSSRRHVSYFSLSTCSSCLLASRRQPKFVITEGVFGSLRHRCGQGLKHRCARAGGHCQGARRSAPDLVRVGDFHTACLDEEGQHDLVRGLLHKHSSEGPLAVARNLVLP